jgi:LPXTG-motif cell wall-anchored protein
VKKLKSHFLIGAMLVVFGMLLLPTVDPQTATYVAFRTAKAAPASVTQLPRTGGIPLALPILFGGGALLLGLAIRRFARQRSD